MVLWFVLMLCALMWNDHCDGRGWVKRILLLEVWLKADERCLNSGSKAAKRVRKASIKYETTRTGDGLTGEDFQNTGTFIVVRSTVFVKSSAHKTHLARDAYHAYWDFPPRNQVHSISLIPKALMTMPLKWPSRSFNQVCIWFGDGQFIF